LNTFTTQQQTFSKTNLLMYLQWYTRPAPDLGGARGPDPGPPPKRVPYHFHMFSHMCDMCVPLSHF